MSGPTRRSSSKANRHEAQEEQTEEHGWIGIEHNTDETRAPRAVVPLVAPLAIPLNGQKTVESPRQIAFDMVDSLAGRFSAYHDLLGRPRSRHLSELPKQNTRTETCVNLPREVDPTLLLGTRDFFGLCCQLPQQRHDSLASTSLELQLLASAMSCCHSTSLPLQSNDRRLEIQLAAAQTNELLYQHRPMSLLSTTNPPNQCPSTVGLGGDTIAFQLLPSHPLLPQTPILPMPCAPVTTSALSRAARVTEQFLPFSTEEESRIPHVTGPESFPMVLHRALAELELVEGGRAIATFLPDGLSFCVKDQVLFAKQVLPLFFPKMRSFASFQRQLNLYDFERVGWAGLGRGTYRHKLFVRDYPAISSSMRRTKIKGPHPKGKAKPSSEDSTSALRKSKS